VIYTAEQIELEVSRCSGTWVKRANLRKKLIKESNKLINKEIDEIKKTVRCLKAQGLYESDFRSMYAEITQLEMRLL
jgi:hypothetical protein